MNDLNLKHLIKWTRPDNYAGAQFPEYYCSLFGRSRDSDTLERCNFAVALERLGGESDCGCEDDCKCAVIVVRASHWAVGWVESILIHESATDKLEIADGLRESMKNYCVLDDDAFSEMEYEEAIESLDCFSSDFERELAKFLGLEDLDKFSKKHVSAAVQEIYFNDAGYNGYSDAWVSEQSIRRFIESYEFKDLVKSKNKVALALKKAGVKS